MQSVPYRIQGIPTGLIVVDFNLLLLGKLCEFQICSLVDEGNYTCQKTRFSPSSLRILM